jgi:hypothetical protein
MALVHLVIVQAKLLRGAHADVVVPAIRQQDATYVKK